MPFQGLLYPSCWEWSWHLSVSFLALQNALCWESHLNQCGIHTSDWWMKGWKSPATQPDMEQFQQSISPLELPMGLVKAASLALKPSLPIVLLRLPVKVSIRNHHEHWTLQSLLANTLYDISSHLPPHKADLTQQPQYGPHRIRNSETRSIPRASELLQESINLISEQHLCNTEQRTVSGDAVSWDQLCAI